MSKLLLLISLLISLQTFSQSHRAGTTQVPWQNDTLSGKIASALGVKKEMADSLLSLIYTSRTAISTVLQNSSLTASERNTRIKMIADARNARIEKWLPPEQIEKLKGIMTVEKEKWKQKPLTNNRK